MFKDSIYSVLKKRLLDNVLATIERDRDGERVDRDVLRNAIGVWTSTMFTRVAHLLFSFYFLSLSSCTLNSEWARCMSMKLIFFFDFSIQPTIIFPNKHLSGCVLIHAQNIL